MKLTGRRSIVPFVQKELKCFCQYSNSVNVVIKAITIFDLNHGTCTYSQDWYVGEFQPS